MRLEQNFRSRQPLLDLANAVRPGSRRPAAASCAPTATGGRRPRLVRCHDASAEARLVVDAVLEAAEQGQPLRDQAVLMRAAHHSDLLEVELTARGVPFVKYGGLKFLEAAHVKDFVAGVRLLDNPADEIAWFRLLRLHDGIGPARARPCSTRCARPTPTSRSRHADAVAAAPAPVAHGAGRHARRAQPARRRRAPRSPTGPTACSTCCARCSSARYPDHAARLGDLDRLVSAAGAAPDAGRVRRGR